MQIMQINCLRKFTEREIIYENDEVMACIETLAVTGCRSVSWCVDCVMVSVSDM